MERPMTRPVGFQAKQVAERPDKNTLPLSPVRRGLRRAQWLISISLFAFVVSYELGLSQWIELRLGSSYHIVIDILIYGIVGPVSTYVALHFLDRWLEERETSELQARLLQQARERAQASTTLSDDALQTLFAASILISSLKSSNPELSPGTKADLARTEESLNHAISRIRDHLES
jgi:signal transduction histidine kinase